MSTSASESFGIGGVEIATRRGLKKVDLLIQGEATVAIGAPGTIVSQRVFDGDGLWAFPGVIDAHVHPIHNESFASLGIAAPFGGVTTVLHHLYLERDEPIESAVERASQEAAEGVADYGFHIRVTRDRLGMAFADFHRVNATAVKVFLAHAVADVELSEAELFEVMTKAASHDLVVYVHSEFGSVIRRATALVGDPESLKAVSELRPPVLEAAAVETVCALAQMTGCRLHLPHLSSNAAVVAALASRSSGVHVTIETCPHYLLLDFNCDLMGLGRVAPPLRSADDVVAMRRHLRDAAFDVVASDHCGYSSDEKYRQPLYSSANGLPGLETLFPLMLDAAIAGEWLTPEKLADALAGGPARVFGLRRKGMIAPGFDADLVLVDPGGKTDVRQEKLHDKSFFTPYEGQRLKGKIVQVIRRGQVVVDDSQAVIEGGGRHVERDGVPR